MQVVTSGRVEQNAVHRLSLAGKDIRQFCPLSEQSEAPRKAAKSGTGWTMAGPCFTHAEKSPEQPRGRASVPMAGSN